MKYKKHNPFEDFDENNNPPPELKESAKKLSNQKARTIPLFLKIKGENK